MSQNFGKVGNKILVKKKTPSVVTVGLGWPAASREQFKFKLEKNIWIKKHAGKVRKNMVFVVSDIFSDMIN